jgi:shikimate dehydrogenase
MTSAREPLVAGLIGWPVHQSKSPIIHDIWLNACGIDGIYARFPVRAGDVEPALRALDALGITGVQATMPHKHACFEAVDTLMPAARALGAVNTVTVQGDGSLQGHNTDLAGFIEPLGDLDLAGRTVTMLGAGGAAAAVLAGLASKKPERINIINRSASAVDKLLSHAGPSLGSVRIESAGWERADALIRDNRLIVNASALGMTGHPPLVIDLAGLPGDALVYDIVTSPYQTDLLKAAAGRGLATVDGLAMLIGQAREAFALFYGQPAPLDRDTAIRQALTA